MNRLHRHRTVMLSPIASAIEPKQKNVPQHSFHTVPQGRCGAMRSPFPAIQPHKMHRKEHGSDTQEERMQSSADIVIVESP